MNLFKLVAVGLLLKLSFPVLADVRIPAAGGSGGNPFIEPCPSGEILVGVDLLYTKEPGSAGINQITPVCVAVAGDGTWIGAARSLPQSHGGVGPLSGGTSNRCPRDQGIIFMAGSSGAQGTAFEDKLGFLGLRCKALVSDTQTEAGPQSRINLPGFGRRETSTLVQEGCHGNTVATGIHGRSGQQIDRLGLICPQHPNQDALAADDPQPNDPDNPYNKGQWSDVLDWPMVAIHAVLTPQGKVLSFGSDDAYNLNNDKAWQGAYIYDVWDPSNGQHNTFENETNVDSFCSAPLLLPDSGKILIAGGDARLITQDTAPQERDQTAFAEEILNDGIQDAMLLDPEAETLTPTSQPMNFARWYPTATTLRNGDILVTGGKHFTDDDDISFASINPEVYELSADARNYNWRTLWDPDNRKVFGYSDRACVPVEYQENAANDGADCRPNAIHDKSGWFYPRQWVSNSGTVVGFAGSKIFTVDVDADDPVKRIGTLPFDAIGYKSTAVMYRPGKILQVGGNGNLNGMGGVLVDINTTPPRINDPNKPAPMHFNRKTWANSTVLPDGSVLVTGGSDKDNEMRNAVRAAERYLPDTNEWEILAEMRHHRLYHSVALLLPDATVLVAGGGAPGPLDFDEYGAGAPRDLMNAEIFSPPYLFNADGTPLNDTQRLKILQFDNQAIETQDPVRKGKGDTLVITHSINRPLDRVVMIKSGAVTHSFNMEQRLVEPIIRWRNPAAGKVGIAINDNAGMLTPGYYLVFLLDADNHPSEAELILIQD